MDCQKRFEELEVPTSFDRAALKYFELSCSAQAPELVAQVVQRIREIDALEEAAWVEAEKADTVAAYKQFLKAWPQGIYRAKAEREVGKRYEIFRSFFVKKTADGGTSARGVVMLLVAIPAFLLIGPLAYIVLIALEAILSAVGLPGMPAAVVSAVILLALVFKAFGTAEIAVSVVTIVVFSVLSMAAWHFAGYG